MEISASSGMAHPFKSPGTEPRRPTDREDGPAATPPARRPAGPSALAETARGHMIAAELSARAAADSEAGAAPGGNPADIDTLRRALISQVFKIDETTDIAAQFGDLRFSEQEMAQAEAFLKGLQGIRQDTPAPDATRDLDRKV